MKTIVGLYSTVAEANKVKTALVSQGYETENIRVIDQSSGDTGSASSTGTDYSSTGANAESIGSRIKGFFSGITESGDESTHRYDDTVHQSYTRGVTGGGALLAVTVQDNKAEETADLLQQHGATDIEGGYGSESGRGYATGTGNVANTGTANRVTGEQVIPVLEEELAVGKRQVERGGVRIYSHIVSEPVSENVSLHNERVVVDRQAVNRQATEADFNPGEKTIEVHAMGEEAVVGKRSRVVEEIRVGKEASDRTEQINDTVRHTEVDVEPTTTETTTSTTGTTPVRR